MKTVVNTMLDPTRRSNDAREFESALRRRIVGQDQAVEKVVEIYQMFLAGLNPPGRPVGNLLFLGPTGSGKTRVVEAMAEALFGDARACIKIDCAEFQHSHEIAKLIGSPPGYLGHRETHPLLTQEAEPVAHREAEALDSAVRRNREGLRLALAVAARHSGQGHLDPGRQPPRRSFAVHHHHDLEPGRQRDEQHGRWRPRLLRESRLQVDAAFDDKINRTAVDAARRKFSPEFMNRIDKSVVFKTLRSEHLQQILEIELGMVQQRILMASAVNQFVFSCTPKVKSFLLQEGTDPKYGARHLKRAIERHIVFQLANLVATGQIKLGDFIRIDMSPEGKLMFVKEAENAMVPMLLERQGAAAGALPMARPARTVARREFGATGTLDGK